MPTIKGSYPHHLSFEPRPMKAPVIWGFAETIRRQVLRMVHRRVVDVREVAGRTESLLINGIAFSLVWDFDNPVHDEEGHPVMGICEHDACEPGQVMISVNGSEVGSRPEIERSTALHELGHALFDMPAAVHAGRQLCLEFGDERPRRIFRSGAPGRVPQGPMDWREWRANEFMGAFLAPPAAFHQHLIRLANQAGLSLVHRPAHGKQGLPVVDGRGLSGIRFGEVLDLLAEEFGVTGEFARVRIDKYRLLAGREG
ncbi:MAG: hypothetical protein HZC25_08870 [Rhodospirillales bacterium]|nr:hypothetical protein [Rhodospirillales bacterium]